MSALPEAPDLAVIAVPRQQVLETVAECIAARVRHLVIFSSGFAEADDEGRALQQALGASLRGVPVRVLGPNCNGVMVPGLGAPVSFTPLLDRGFPRAGGLAIVVQSAAIGTYLLDRVRERGLGVRYWVHTGNEMDITLEDIVEAASADPEVSSILLSFEVLRAPGRLVRVVKAARARGVTVAALQVATSEEGRRAALSHTGALVSDQAKVAYGLLRQAGVHVADSMRELLDVAVAHPLAPALMGGRAGILTTSGGLGIMLADALSAAGLTVPALSPTLQASLRAIAPYCLTGNPVDSTAQVVNDPGAFRQLLDALVGCSELDLLVVFLATAELGDALTQQVLEVARARAGRSPQPRLVVVGATDVATASTFADAGVVVFSEPADLRLALSATRPAGPRAAEGAPEVLTHHDGALIATLAHDGIVDELESKRILRAAGVRTVEDRRVQTVEDAVAAAAALGHPVALKLIAPGLAHKAAVGGVCLGLTSAAEVQAGATRLFERGAELGLGTGHPELLVEPMCRGIEVFLGITNHPELGPVVVCGRGGVDVERDRRVSFRSFPFARDDVRDVLEEQSLLSCVRSAGAAERLVEHVCTILLALGHTWQQAPAVVRSIDLNPVMVDERGECTVVDALIELYEVPSALERVS